VHDPTVQFSKDSLPVPEGDARGLGYPDNSFILYRRWLQKNSVPGGMNYHR
jgi:hypothetical protein